MYEFKQAITVDTPNGNEAFAAGDQIEAKDVLPGCLQSLLRLNIVVEVPVKPVAPPAKKDK
jgi:hypothetical protein